MTIQTFLAQNPHLEQHFIDQAAALRNERIIARTEQILKDPDYRSDLLLTLIETCKGTNVIWDALRSSTSTNWMSLIAMADMAIVDVARAIAESEERRYS